MNASLPASPAPLRRLHQDDRLIVVAKPAGLLVHRSALDAHERDSVVDRLQAETGQRPWPVHRLDKGTSGVLLFALDAQTASLLGRRFESGEGLRKTYRAVVRGWPPDEGLIDHPLKRMPDDMRTDREEVQDAVTRFRTLARYELPLPRGGFETTRCALLELQPLTGRRHQLRRHCKHIAHPLIGDATHGKGPLNRTLAAFLGEQRLWLHAVRQELVHPVTGQALPLQADSGPEWRVWDRWRIPGERSPVE